MWTYDGTHLIIHLVDHLPSNFTLPLDFNKVQRSAGLNEQIDLTSPASQNRSSVSTLFKSK